MNYRCAPSRFFEIEFFDSFERRTLTRRTAKRVTTSVIFGIPCTSGAMNYHDGISSPSVRSEFRLSSINEVNRMDLHE